MDKKLLWTDVETSGLNERDNDIIELAVLVDINGEIVDNLTLRIQPVNWDSISDEALKHNGILMETLKTFDEPKVAYKKLTDFLGKYVNKYDRKDKFMLAGYNCGFDAKFLEQFFLKQGDKYYASWFKFLKLDVAVLLSFAELYGKLQLPDYKLATVAKLFGIDFKAHEAEADIKATKLIAEKLAEVYGMTVDKTKTEKNVKQFGKMHSILMKELNKDVPKEDRIKAYTFATVKRDGHKTNGELVNAIITHLAVASTNDRGYIGECVVQAKERYNKV